MYTDADLSVNQVDIGLVRAVTPPNSAAGNHSLSHRNVVRMNPPLAILWPTRVVAVARIGFHGLVRMARCGEEMTAETIKLGFI